MSAREPAGPTDTSFYEAVYGNFGGELTAQVRAETFDEDIGQNSWLTASEHRMFLGWLGLDPSCEVLEIASGSGGPALMMVRETGCRVTGIELNQAGVAAANDAATRLDLVDRARFIEGDAREPLPFANCSFDVVLCIDSINHMYERQQVFAEWHRVLRPDGHALFTDPLTVAGMIRREEMLRRTGSLGEQVFTPAGVDEGLLLAAGFAEVRMEDATGNMAAVSAARRRARTNHARELDQLEGGRAREDYDEYLRVVELLASERRLTRIAYMALKPR